DWQLGATNPVGVHTSGAIRDADDDVDSRRFWDFWCTLSLGERAALVIAAWITWTMIIFTVQQWPALAAQTPGGQLLLSAQRVVEACGAAAVMAPSIWKRR